MQDETKLRYWREEDEWRCAVPRDDIATRNGFHWKRYGLVGRGKTRKEALADWRVWQRCSDLVAGIY